MSKFTLILDSSQISLFLECPMKWYYTYVLKLVPVSYDPLKSEEAMHSGTYGHKLLDIFYRSKMEGLTLKQTIERCYAYDPDKDLCECGHPQDLHNDIPIGNEILSECQRCRHCIKYKCKPFPLTKETRQLVFNRFHDYIHKWKDNDFLPHSAQPVEVGFSEPVFEDSENLFVLEGRLDLLASYQDNPCLVDHKFQQSTHWLYPKSIQFKNYCLVSDVRMLVINYIRLTKTLGPETLYRDVTAFSRVELEAWKSRLINIFFDIKKVIQSGVYPQRWDSCSGKQKTFKREEPRYCWYGQLCEESSDVMRERRKDMLYKIKTETWKPW